MKLNSLTSQICINFKRHRIMEAVTLSEARVYVGTYNKYNNGSLFGKWLDLSDYSDKDEFMEACRELHKDDQDPEFMFQDYENIPEALISESWLSEKFFELRDAIVKKDVVKANRIVKYFDNNPKAGNLHSIVPQLFNFFQNLMLAFYCPDRLREDALATWLGLRGGWAARDYIAAMKVYNAMKTM